MKNKIIKQIDELLQRCDVDLLIAFYNVIYKMQGGKR